MAGDPVFGMAVPDCGEPDLGPMAEVGTRSYGRRADRGSAGQSRGDRGSGEASHAVSPSGDPSGGTETGGDSTVRRAEEHQRCGEGDTEDGGCSEEGTVYSIEHVTG